MATKRLMVKRGIKVEVFMIWCFVFVRFENCESCDVFYRKLCDRKRVSWNWNSCHLTHARIYSSLSGLIVLYQSENFSAAFRYVKTGINVVSFGAITKAPIPSNVSQNLGTNTQMSQVKALGQELVGHHGGFREGEDFVVVRCCGTNVDQTRRSWSLRFLFSSGRLLQVLVQSNSNPIKNIGAS